MFKIFLVLVIITVITVVKTNDWDYCYASLIPFEANCGSCDIAAVARDARARDWKEELCGTLPYNARP